MRTTAILFLSLFILAGCNDDTGTLTGVVTDDYGELVSGAVITLDDSDYKATTDKDGRYVITDIEPGVYDVTCMSLVFDFDLLSNVEIWKGETTELNLNPYSKDYEDVVRKPNIYLYPEETTDVSVNLNFPTGGGVTVSEPMYVDGWYVTASPEGWLTTPEGRGYGYLFFEADPPDEWQRMSGWLIDGEDLAGFFDENLRAYGFNDREVGDFIEYWEPRLTANQYAVFPQLNEEIEPLIGLDVYPEPDSVLRLYYYLVADPILGGLLGEPEIPTFEREGFTVVEWGVVQ